MKRLPAVLYLSLFLASSFAQSSMQGVYLSANDFNNNKISLPPLKGKKYKLQLNETFRKPIVRIFIGDSTYVVNKDSAFGYHDNENTAYRFFEKDSYKILNPSENILIYCRTFPGGYKNTQTIIKYYFSVNSNEIVQPLTRWNLKTAFAGDPTFIELVDMYFNSDNELIDYDSFYKMYKINHVLQVSRQQISKTK